MDHLQGTEINIAGYPKQVVAGQPPFWRYRLTRLGEEIGIRNWRVTGMAIEGNNWQGFEAGASFLLWWALYGDLIVEDETAVITLLPHPRYSFAALAPSIRSLPAGLVRIYANPKRAREQQTPPYWLLCSADEEIPVVGFTLRGTTTDRNAFPGVADNKSDHARSVWLNVHGAVHLDSGQHALIDLSAP